MLKKGMEMREFPMYELTGESIFDEYAKCWERQQKNPICKGLAFIKKSIQKILEK